MKKNKNKSGFTVIEILLVIAIISILVTVILVNIFSARTKSNDMSVFYSMRGTADVAFACLTGRASGVALSSMESAYTSICIYDMGGVYAADSSYSDWPDVSKDSWSGDLRYALGEDGFYWCNLGSSGVSHPTFVGAYSDGSIGGWAAAGNFCYMLKNGDKYIWCTQSGCRKEGF